MSYKLPATPLRVAINHDATGRQPYRPAVGDIVRSPKFRVGLRPGHGGAVWVGVPETHVASLVSSTRGTLSVDETRSSALFLVTDTNLDHGEGPDDVEPGHNRLTRVIEALRLTEFGELLAGAERIKFNLDEAMSLAQVDLEQLEFVGYVNLPINWEEKS